MRSASEKRHCFYLPPMTHDEIPCGKRVTLRALTVRAGGQEVAGGVGGSLHSVGEKPLSRQRGVSKSAQKNSCMTTLSMLGSI